MRRLTIPEHRSLAYRRVDTSAAAALAKTRAVRVGADLAGRTTLTSGSNVGVLTAGDVEVRITPKVGIRRLLWLLGYAQNPDGWRHDDKVLLADLDDLVPALAISYLDAANRALAHGVLQDYHQREEALPVLRGRLREADQLRRHLGFPVPVEVRYDDYDVDIPENQILLAATRRLLRLPGIPPPTRAGLRHLTVQLSDVSALRAHRGPPATLADRRTRHYRPALDLAGVVLAGRSIEQRAGHTVATGFVFDLNIVFEQWLTTALRHALRPHGGSLTSQWRDHLDTASKVPVRPDLVWHHARRPAAVADAKYKVLDPGARPHGDLYQLLAYCTILALPAGHLIYADGDARPSTHTVRHAGIKLCSWALDLAKPVAGLLADIDIIAEALAGTHLAARAATRSPV
jgi:5-methylcytosine-specific restriction enzyme subunit McrC